MDISIFSELTVDSQRCLMYSHGHGVNIVPPHSHASYVRTGHSHGTLRFSLLVMAFKVTCCSWKHHSHLSRSIYPSHTIIASKSSSYYIYFALPCPPSVHNHVPSCWMLLPSFLLSTKTADLTTPCVVGLWEELF